MIKKRFVWVLLFSVFFSSGILLAFQPVARFDVVPYQRIKFGQSFKVGVVAFSKPGIERVDFWASGQGYASGTKTVTAMSLNDQTGVWEYWASFPASEFTSNGAVTIYAQAKDNNGNKRNLSLSMIAEGASAFTPVSAWVSPSGDDTTGAVNNSSLPFKTISTAKTKIQAANGGNSNGAVIYLKEGTYSVSGISASTTNEWLTIAKDQSANRNNVIINTGLFSTGYLKYDSVTLQSRGSGLYVANDSATRLWTNNCRRIGSGYDIVNSNPVNHSSDNHYSTGDYIFDADYGYRRAALVRGAELVQVGVDSFQNTAMVINATSMGQVNSTGLHADAYQVFSLDANSPPANNRIIYNFKATDIHYQGIFARSDYGQATDNAFVNVFIEMREPPMRNESNLYSFGPHSFYHSWDHLIMWNCTFIGHCGGMYGTYTNSSFVGNIFDAYVSQESAVGVPTIPSAEPGNTSNNEFLHNHFNQIYKETADHYRNAVYVESGWPCPLWGSKRPDSGSPATYSKDYGVLDTDYLSSKFGYPLDGSVLINRFPSRVPIDVNNVERAAVSDVGAVEYVSSTSSAPSLNYMISGVSPGAVFSTGTVGITLSGAGFPAGAQASMFNASVDGSTTAATNVSVASSSRITFNINLSSGAAPGYWTVAVTSGSYRSELKGSVNVRRLWRVLSVTPGYGFENGGVIISDLTGENFLAGSAVKLSKSGQPDTFATNVNVVNSSKITCELDLSGKAVGFWDIVITSGALTNSATGVFEIKSGGWSVGSVSPSAAYNYGEVAVTDLGGTGFFAGSTVKLSKFGESDIAGTNVSVVSGNKITCRFDLTLKATGYWDVVVASGAFSSRLSGGFEVKGMEVHSIAPSSSYSGAVLNVTVSGQGFLEGSSILLRKSGESDIAADNVAVTSDKITCRIDLSGKAKGVWDVAVTSGVFSAVLPGGFEVKYNVTASAEPR